VTPDDEALRQLVLRSYVERASPPDLAGIARALDIDLDTARQGLQRLHDAHRLVLDAAGDIRMAHPFSSRPMHFVVASAQQKWWGGCAWDSVGIGAALDTEVLIATTCPDCGRPHALRSAPDRAPESDAVAHFLVPGPHWWDDVVDTCSHIRICCDESHARRWESRHGRGPGAVIDLHTLWRLGHRWYGDRLRPDFRPFTPAEAIAVFAELGLSGPFWRL